MDSTDRNCREGVLCWRLELVANSGLKVAPLSTKKHWAYPVLQALSIYGSICTKDILLDVILVILSDIEYYFPSADGVTGQFMNFKLIH